MTNYEKLISSIILSAVLSKTTYGLGCGCNCFDDDEDNKAEIKSQYKYEEENNNKKQEGTNNGKKKNLIAMNNQNIVKYNNESSSFSNVCEYLISTIIKKKDKNVLLQLFTIESQIFDVNNKTNEDNILKGEKDLKNQNIQLIKEMYKNFQEEYQKKVDEKFSYDFCEENKDQIEGFDPIQQLTIVSFLINLINSISKENQTIEKFSETCLYHNLKQEHNKTTHIPDDFSLKKQSPIKRIYQKLRNQLFLSLFNYTMNYIDLCYLKFGEGFWIKKKETTNSLSKFFSKNSDKNKTIKEMFSNCNFYNNVCDMPFSKITNIKEKINSLPNFSDVFEQNNKKYKIKEGQIENFKEYFNFLEEKNSTLLEHEKNINNFFTSLPKLEEINKIQDENFVNMTFAFKRLEVPVIKLT